IKERKTGFPVGWTDDIRLTNDTTQDVTCRIAVEGDIAHLIWEKDTTGAGGHYDIFYRNSTDAGNKWSIPIRLTNGTSGVYCRNPDLGISSSDLHVVWDDNDGGGREIKYCNSTDGGITWNSPKRISTDDAVSEGGKIAVSDSNLHTIWHDARYGSLQTEIYYRRSIDGGITWDDGLGSPNLDRRLTHDLSDVSGIRIAIYNSNIHILFYDSRDGSFDVYYIRSTDNGATWNDGLGNVDEERKLTANSTDHAPGAIAVNGSTIHVAWIDEVWPGPNYYMYYCNSTDNGATWNPIQLLVDSGTAYNPSIDTSGNEVHVVWDDWRDGTAKEIYYKNSTDGGINWNSKIRLTSEDGNSSAGPKIAVSGGHKHITWEDQRDGNREIYYKRYPDFPPETDPPSHTNETPPPDSYRDAPGTNISVHVTDPSGVNNTT
ncbi:MAG: exo-alpha-sialidase, partial [Thermoplasmata archaeon]|nr:exo-alpha-sialidase [Thermoplasmata archaeon]